MTAKRQRAAGRRLHWPKPKKETTMREVNEPDKSLLFFLTTTTRLQQPNTSKFTATPAAKTPLQVLPRYLPFSDSYFSGRSPSLLFSFTWLGFFWARVSRSFHFQTATRVFPHTDCPLWLRPSFTLSLPIPLTFTLLRPPSFNHTLLLYFYKKKISFYPIPLFSA